MFHRAQSSCFSSYRRINICVCSVSLFVLIVSSDGIWEREMMLNILFELFVKLYFIWERGMIFEKEQGYWNNRNRESTHNDIYLHWDYISREYWKRGTLKTLHLRIHMVCCNHYLLEKEFKQLDYVFCKANGHPT